MMIWTGTIFRQSGMVLTEGGKTTETVFDKPYALIGAAEQLAGRTTVFENGEEAGRGAWSNVVSRGKSVKVTVPAGTFTATRWEGAFILGHVKQVYTVHAVGVVEVRADIDIFVKGDFSTRLAVELQKGPVTP